MKVGKLCKIGDCAGVVIPRQLREQLGWFTGDQIAQHVSGNTLVLQNVTERLTRPILNRKESGDVRANGYRRVR